MLTNVLGRVGERLGDVCHVITHVDRRGFWATLKICVKKPTSY